MCVFNQGHFCALICIVYSCVLFTLFLSDYTFLVLLCYQALALIPAFAGRYGRRIARKAFMAPLLLLHDQFESTTIQKTLFSDECSQDMITCLGLETYLETFLSYTVGAVQDIHNPNRLHAVLTLKNVSASLSFDAMRTYILDPLLQALPRPCPKAIVAYAISSVVQNLFSQVAVNLILPFIERKVTQVCKRPNTRMVTCVSNCVVLMACLVAQVDSETVLDIMTRIRHVFETITRCIVAPGNGLAEEGRKTLVHIIGAVIAVMCRSLGRSVAQEVMGPILIDYFTFYGGRTTSVSSVEGSPTLTSLVSSPSRGNRSTRGGNFGTGTGHTISQRSLSGSILTGGGDDDTPPSALNTGASQNVASISQKHYQSRSDLNQSRLNKKCSHHASSIKHPTDISHVSDFVLSQQQGRDGVVMSSFPTDVADTNSSHHATTTISSFEGRDLRKNYGGIESALVKGSSSGFTALVDIETKAFDIGTIFTPEAATRLYSKFCLLMGQETMRRVLPNSSYIERMMYDQLGDNAATYFSSDTVAEEQWEGVRLVGALEAMSKEIIADRRTREAKSPDFDQPQGFVVAAGATDPTLTTRSLWETYTDDILESKADGNPHQNFGKNLLGTFKGHTNAIRSLDMAVSRCPSMSSQLKPMLHI